MTKLFEPARHEALAGAAWDDAAARAGVEAIVADACARFDAETLWPRHPRDHEKGDPLDRPSASLYDGAAGVIWALDRLRERGYAGRDFDDVKPALLGHQRRYSEVTGADARSFALGEAGVRLLAYRADPTPEAADALFALVEGNLHNPAREFLWGSPGSLQVALHMLDAGADERWADVFRRGVAVLWDEMEPAAGRDGVWLWTQDMYGYRLRHLGAGHGFAGNVHPVLRGARWLSRAQVDAFEERTLRTLEADVLTDGDDAANWEPVFDRASHGYPSKPLMQDCHGAPGIVCRLAGCSQPALRRWLVRGGEGVWRAGPLAKAAGLCHGTAGNGYAFLKLYRMTGDAHWLERARAFAMHALMQVEREAAIHGQRWISLWTGDLGVALYVAACFDGDDRFPTLDDF
jgi:hypothetical protein